MYRCLHGTGPPYLMDSCTLTADVTGRQHLRSATQRKLIVPRYRLNGFGRRRFAVAGPSTWNSLPDTLRDPELSQHFQASTEDMFFTRYLRQNVLSALEIFLSMRYINVHFTYSQRLSERGFCAKTMRSAPTFLLRNAQSHRKLSVRLFVRPSVPNFTVSWSKGSGTSATHRLSIGSSLPKAATLTNWSCQSATDLGPIHPVPV